jgi:hypothetical protein
MLLGVSVIACPWIFPHPEAPWRLLNDVACGLLVVMLAALSFFGPTRWAHIGIGGVGLWLGATAYLAVERPGPPAAQYEIVLACLLLLMFLIPNEATRPPESWRRTQ